MTVRCGGVQFPNTNFKTSLHCIAYLDVLGGANKICNDKDNDFLNHLNMFMQDAIEETKMFSQGLWKIHTKIFSDNILFAVEIKENDIKEKEKIATIFNLVSNIVNEFFKYGHLMRGAIVLGEFFQNDNIVYGKGLVRAVRIEENEAMYPRIIVDNEVEKIMPQCCLLDEKDNKFILNTFLYSQHFDYLDFKSYLLEMLNEHKDNQDIREKIMWAITYYNCWYSQDLTKLGENVLITEEEIKDAFK